MHWRQKRERISGTDYFVGFVLLLLALALVLHKVFR
ncbi:hypothetical protein FBZ96_11970 [Bradyrhizobium stylosanthis]|uniref:Uncharacterized protein n=1 Tax=Bradyrhizobium stylosanthis TaxID=1803665 RepID=A0A560CXK7_9BRAD|nr:hypothetical protein FBZ96_11970 [Bradyrhizobium stylosanthis]